LHSDVILVLYETTAMATKPSFPAALRTIRKARGLSQEAFSDVSSRTYLSSLERGLKSPTLVKIEQLCDVLQIHPLTLLALSYAGHNQARIDQLLDRIGREISELAARERATS